MKRVLFAVSLLLGLSVLFSSCEKSGAAGEDGADASGAVDLGLSVKWASCNLGASKPEEYGDYYSWGETSPKEVYTKETYKYYIGKSRTDEGFLAELYSKYVVNPDNGTIDNKIQLDPADDAAHVKLGGKWRMPTEKECQELVDKCIWTYQSRMGVCGYEVKSSVNGNSIFLPLSGYRVESHRTAKEEEVGYLSSSLYTNTSIRNSSRNCVVMYADDCSDVYMDYDNRFDGFPIRPVKGK